MFQFLLYTLFLDIYLDIPPKLVALIDTDIGLRNLDLLMGLENRIVYNIVDYVEDRCRLNQALVKDKRLPNLSRTMQALKRYGVSAASFVSMA